MTRRCTVHLLIDKLKPTDLHWCTRHVCNKTRIGSTSPSKSQLRASRFKLLSQTFWHKYLKCSKFGTVLTEKNCNYLHYELMLLPLGDGIIGLIHHVHVSMWTLRLTQLSNRRVHFSPFFSTVYWLTSTVFMIPFASVNGWPLNLWKKKIRVHKFPWCNISWRPCMRTRFPRNHFPQYCACLCIWGPVEHNTWI